MPRRSSTAHSDSEIAPDLFAASLSLASRHFLGWDRSLVKAVVEHVAAGWDGRGALDLSGVLIIVPTRSARTQRSAKRRPHHPDSIAETKLC